MRLLQLCTLTLPLILTGCTLSPNAAPSAEPGLPIQGRVQGGQQPINGAHVYLFAANTTGYGAASTPLLNASATGFSDSVGAYVPTDTNGNFNITGDYSCTPNTQVYVYALGGDPGAGANSAAGLMAILGNCPAAGNFAAATPFVWVNEVSTIAAAYAMAGFAVDATHVSSSGTALAQTGIANAFANAANLANLATGAALTTTPAGNAVVPQTTIDTLANILAACVNSTGPASNGCSTLFSNILSAGATGTAATDTATAAIYLAHNPAVNIATLCGLQLPTSPFPADLPCNNISPNLYPNDFTLGLNFTGGGITEPQGVAIDASGNAWVTNFTGKSITLISSSGAFLSGAAGYSGGGISGPWGVAIDLDGYAWVANQTTNSITEITSTGSILSGTAGYTANATLDFPRAIAIDASNNVWIANFLGNTVTVLSHAGAVLSGTGYTGGTQDFIYFPQAIAIGPDGSAWVANQDGNNVTRLTLSGAVLSGQFGYTGGGIDDPYGIAIDSSGNGWVASIAPGNGGVTKISNTGTLLSGSSGYTGGGIFRPYAIAIDGGGNAWVANDDGNDVTEISNSGVFLSGSTSYKGGNINQPAGVAIDGSGDIWLTNHGLSTVTELIGAATPVVTPLAAGVANNTLGSRP
jgi:sugar lactone lactonase YvrE